MTRLALLAAPLLLSLGACGGPQGRPTLPPPEYEDPAPALSSPAAPASSAAPPAGSTNHP
jgi:hypothetical protein